MDKSLVSVMILTVIIGIPCLTAIVMKIVETVALLSRNQQEVALKLKMVERGYSAGEIERICRLGVAPETAESEWQPIAPAKPLKV